MRFDMGSETYAQLLYCLQHGLTVAFDDCDIEDNCGFGNVADVFSNVELLQFIIAGKNPGKGS